MKKRKPIFSLFLFVSLTITSLNNRVIATIYEDGGITGMVKDGISEKPMEYATVALYRQHDSTLIAGAVTNAEGRFGFQKVPAGGYYLIANFLGYGEQLIRNIKLETQGRSTDVGVILLKPDVTQMEGVQITGKKEAIEHHIDKDVINVDQQLNAAGGTAVEVLENHPSVAVDMDGNLTLRGSTDFMVLIDGKPTAKTYYRKTRDIFFYVLDGNEPGVITGFPDNLDKATDLGVEISGDIELSSWWKINSSFIFYRSALQGVILEQYIDRTAHIWRSRLKTTFDLRKNTTLQLTGFYNSPVLRPQGKNIAAYAINASLRQRLLNKKLILTLSANNLFNLRRYGATDINENFVREWDTRQKFSTYTFNLSYKFNNFNKKDREEGDEGLGF